MKSIDHSLTAYIELSTAYMPHASLVANAFLKLFSWGVTDCSRSVHFWQDGSENRSPAGHGHTPLFFHFATMQSSTVAVMLSTVTSFCFLSACTITGVSSVSRGCSDVILAGCTTQEGAGAPALVWAVHAISTKAFSAVEAFSAVIGSTVGVTRVQKAHASEFYVHVCWKPVGLSDVYRNNNMIE